MWPTAGGRAEDSSSVDRERAGGTQPTPPVTRRLRLPPGLPSAEEGGHRSPAKWLGDVPHSPETKRPVRMKETEAGQFCALGFHVS